MPTLTHLNNGSILCPSAPHWADGLGRPFSSGAEAMRHQVCSFFYALRFFSYSEFPNSSIMAGGVLGGFTACRFQNPVDQPNMSSAALSLVASVGGLLAIVLEFIMNYPTTGEIRPTVSLVREASPVLVPVTLSDSESKAVHKALAILEKQVINQKPFLPSSFEVQSLLRLRFAGLTNEQFHVLYLNSQLRLQEIHAEAFGDANSTVIDFRPIVLRAISLGAASVIFAHNHPGGSASPSIDDISHLRYAKSVLSPLNIHVIDSFVVTAQEVVSINEYLVQKAAKEQLEKDRQRKLKRLLKTQSDLEVIQ